MVGDDEHVASAVAVAVARAHGPEQLAEGPVEDPIDLGDRAVAPALLPVGPGQVVDVVGRHEDREEELRRVLRGEPADDLDALRAGAADVIEVDRPAAVEREGVVEQQPTELVLQLGDQRARVGHAVLARRGVHSGDHEAVHLRSGPRERDVHDADASPARREPRPQGGRAAVAAVDEPEPVAALVALGEVPDSVPSRVDARDHRRPRERGQRMRGRAQRPARPARHQRAEVRQVARRDERVDDVERRRVESDDREIGRSHLKFSLGHICAKATLGCVAHGRRRSANPYTRASYAFQGDGDRARLRRALAGARAVA